jgi:hypothetical protein
MRYFSDPKIVNPRQTWRLEVLPKHLFGARAGGPTEPAEGWGYPPRRDEMGIKLH